MTPGNCYANYNQTRVYTASQKELLLMLYDGAIRFLRIGREGVEEKHIEKAHNNLIRAKRIILELISTVNREQGELADNLLSLYNFMFRRIVEANVRKEVEPIDESIGILTTLREGWTEVKAKSAGELRGRAGGKSGGNELKA